MLVDPLCLFAVWLRLNSASHIKQWATSFLALIGILHTCVTESQIENPFIIGKLHFLFSKYKTNTTSWVYYTKEKKTSNGKLMRTADSFSFDSTTRLFFLPSYTRRLHIAVLCIRCLFASRALHDEREVSGCNSFLVLSSYYLKWNRSSASL